MEVLQEKKKSKLIPTVIGVVVLGGLLFGGLQYAKKNPKTSSQAAPQTPANTGSYSITAGAGGTKKALDGITPIGYSGDCKSAVEAATNYFIATHSLEPSRGDKAKESMRQWTNYEDKELVDRDVNTNKNIIALDIAKEEMHPEQGGYQIQNCIEKQSAVINIAGAWYRTNTKEAKSQTWFQTMTVVVQWDGDWKLQNQHGDPSLDNAVPDTRSGTTPLDASERRKWLKALPGTWNEYANAPK